MNAKIVPNIFKYGVLLQGASEENKRKFTENLYSAVFFTKDEVRANHQTAFKTAQEIHVMAIGHGYTNTQSINDSIDTVAAIKSVMDELGIDNASKVTKFRLQVCHREKAVTCEDDGREKLRVSIIKSLEEFKSTRGIKFSCPQRFSYIKNGSYADTNAYSLDEYYEKKTAKSLQENFSIKSEILPLTAQRAR